jgi:hypothetical protein
LESLPDQVREVVEVQTRIAALLIAVWLIAVWAGGGHSSSSAAEPAQEAVVGGLVVSAAAVVAALAEHVVGMSVEVVADLEGLALESILRYLAAYRLEVEGSLKSYGHTLPHPPLP